MTLHAGIFGYPIGHSISPVMHNAAFKKAEIDAVYEAWQTPPDDLAEGVASLRGESYLGANITVPHKQAVMEHLDEIDELAARVGAVNTIVNQNGRLIGSNTDALGFINSLQNEAGVNVSGLKIVLIGAGGAARAAAHALADEQAGEITIGNRTVERAASLAEEMREAGAETVSFSISDPDFLSACERADLIVNSTSVGMLHGPAEDESPIPASAISPGCVVYDMVYNPTRTPLLTDAENVGAQVVGGLPMLVYQGAAAWTRWTGREAPVEVMFEAAKEALGL